MTEIDESARYLVFPFVVDSLAKTKILNIPNIVSEMGLDFFKMTKIGANPETWPKKAENHL